MRSKNGTNTYSWRESETHVDPHIGRGAVSVWVFVCLNKFRKIMTRSKDQKSEEKAIILSLNKENMLRKDIALQVGRGISSARR